MKYKGEHKIMTSQTMYQSIERLHEKGAKFSEKHPIIPSINSPIIFLPICLQKIRKRKQQLNNN